MLTPLVLAFGLVQLADIASALKVAVIGAGAGGSSAAYLLSLAEQRASNGTKISITVYEKGDRIGGRTTTVYPYNDTAYAPVELGASIFLVPFDGAMPGLGIWDGKEFVWRTTNDATADMIRMAERYQNGPSASARLIAQFLSSFAKSYTPACAIFHSIYDYYACLSYRSLENFTLKSYFDSNGVNQNWTNEYMTGNTRFNYAQDIDKIQVIPGFASLSADVAYSAKTGNFKIFEGLLAKSGATLKLGSEVVAVAKCPSELCQPNWRYVVATKNGVAGFDALIIANPIPLSRAKYLKLPQLSSLPVVRYVQLYVMLPTTTTPSLLPAYFGADNSSALPGTVPTTAAYGTQPEFNSVRYQATIDRDGKTEYLVKIFSLQPITSAKLDVLFGKGKVGWVYRKTWNAYPYFPPRSEFPPMRLDQGLYYVNAMEGLWSTMETETIASRGMVDQLTTELIHSGICGPNGVKGPMTDNYVFGWDC